MTTDPNHYASPGTPPWIQTPPKPRQGLPAWAWVSMILGGLVIFCGCMTVISVFADSPEPEPISRVVPAPAPSPVAVTGTCEKRIVGDYALAATVRATSASQNSQSGVIWVRWPITGEAAQEFTKRITLAPGQTVEFLVNERVTGDRWLRMGECSYGWTPGVRKAPAALKRVPVKKTAAPKPKATATVDDTDLSTGTGRSTGSRSGGSRRSRW